MPPKLRPRQQLPPSDHNYAKSLTHTPLYGENSWPLIVSGTAGIFHQEAESPRDAEKVPDRIKVEPRPIKIQTLNPGRKIIRIVRRTSMMNIFEVKEVPVTEIIQDTKENKIKVVIKETVAPKKEVKEENIQEKSEATAETKEDDIKPKRKRKRFFKGTTFEPKKRRRKRTMSTNSLSQTASDQKENMELNDSGIVADISEAKELSMDEGKVSEPTTPLTEKMSGLYDLQVANPDEPNKFLAQPMKMKRICNSCTTSCHWPRKKRGGSLPPESDSRRQSERLIKLNYKFPFESLPDVCKFKIFSYLTPCEKGVAAQVCVEWNQLMKSPGLWSHLNFSMFHHSSQMRNKSRLKTSALGYQYQYPVFNSSTEYDDYKQRVSKFLSFLESVRPKLKHLVWSYDIGQPKDDWLNWIIEMLRKSQCQNLTYVNMDWTWTPLRLPSSDRYCCLFNKMQMKYRLHEKRIRCFNKLQDALAKEAPNLSHLKMPFDWSPRSVLLLCRLKNLQTLQLGQYMMLTGVQQEMMDTLLHNMPQLRELEMKICSPNYNSSTTYAINHKYLELLDISGCKGFFLSQLDCPNLKFLKIGRYPWKGKLIEKETNTLPCIYALCKKGTPQLVYINRHHVHAYWMEFLYDELNSVLSKLCSCKDHLYGEPRVIPDPGPGPEDDPDGNPDEQGDHPGPLVQGLGIKAPEIYVPPKPPKEIVSLKDHLDYDFSLYDKPLSSNSVPKVQDNDPQPGTSKDGNYTFTLGGPSTCGVSSGDKDKNSVVEPKCTNVSTKATASSTSSVSDQAGDDVKVSKVGNNSRAKVKRSQPKEAEDKADSDSSSEPEEPIPIGHPTVEVRSTPYVRTILPYIPGAATHVAVIPIRVVDPRAVPGGAPPVVTTGVPLAIQSITLRPQVIAVDKTTGTHVLSGPLTIIRQIIPVRVAAATVSSNPANLPNPPVPANPPVLGNPPVPTDPSVFTNSQVTSEASVPTSLPSSIPVNRTESTDKAAPISTAESTGTALKDRQLDPYTMDSTVNSSEIATPKVPDIKNIESQDVTSAEPNSHDTVEPIVGNGCKVAPVETPVKESPIKAESLPRPMEVDPRIDIDTPSEEHSPEMVSEQRLHEQTTMSVLNHCTDNIKVKEENVKSTSDIVDVSMANHYELSQSEKSDQNNEQEMNEKQSDKAEIPMETGEPKERREENTPKEQ